ncbi:MAG: hypothetical protein KGL54_08090 [Sphingomonadales bacterium]|nr:hypothetical protein [Sphingomonadales bacterium]
MNRFRSPLAAGLLLLSASASAGLPGALRFSIAQDPDYDIVTISDARGRHIATINEIDFPNPVVYPAPDRRNIIVLGGISGLYDIDDTLIYVRLHLARNGSWSVLNCETKTLFRITGSKDYRATARIAKSSLMRAVRGGKGVPGEQCKPAREIQKGSRTY